MFVVNPVVRQIVALPNHANRSEQGPRRQAGKEINILRPPRHTREDQGGAPDYQQKLAYPFGDLIIHLPEQLRNNTPSNSIIGLGQVL